MFTLFCFTIKFYTAQIRRIEVVVRHAWSVILNAFDHMAIQTVDLRIKSLFVHKSQVSR
jgi:hypothetical protein